MASARFRLGYGSTSTGPWTWAAYDTAIDVTAGQYVKVELESTAGVESFVCDVPSGDEAAIAATLPVVTNDSASKTGVFQVKSSVGAQTLLVRVQINGGRDENDQSTWGRASQLAVHVLTCDQRLIAVGETDESDRTYYWAEKVNTAIRNSAVVPAITHATPATCAIQATAIGTLVGMVVLGAISTVGSDDAARFEAVADVCSAQGWPLRFAPGNTFQWRTVIETPSNLHATGYGARIRSYLAESGLGQTNCVFVQKMGAVTLTTHLTADAVIGSDSITLYDAVQPGDILHLAHEPSTFRAMNVEVVSCTGSAHSYTVVIDRPVTMQFVTNDPVTVHASRPRNITIEGLEISGTGDRYGEFEGGVNCHFKNIRTTTTGGNCIGPQLAHDVGNERCSITGCILDCGDYSQCGGAIETGDNSWMENDTVKRATVCGYWFLDSVACRGTAIHAYDCATAWSISGETTTEGGCFDCVLENSIASKITYYGVLIDAGTTRQTVRHVRVDKAADGVILLHSAVDTLLDDIYCTGCDVSFFIGTSSGTVGRKWISKASATDGVRIQGDVSISGLVIEHTAGHGIFLTSGVGKVKIDDFKITSTGVLNSLTCDASTPEVYMSRGYLYVGSSGSAGFIPQGGGGKYYLRDMQIVAGGGTTAIYAYTSGISIIDRGGLEITGAGTALTLASGSYANWGTFVNNGASDVTTTNALAALGKIHIVGLHTVGGTVGALPFVKAITAGTSFVTAGVAGDTSTYSYRIEV